MVEHGGSFSLPPVVANNTLYVLDDERPVDRLPLKRQGSWPHGQACPPSRSSAGPNVGKSTLFNRLVGKKLALVDDRPGVTRDRREGEANLLGLDFRVIDTAGYEDEDPRHLPGRMRAQTSAAVREADVALFLIDARAGVTPQDEEIARWLRSEATPVILAANKAEGRAGRGRHPGGLCARARRADRDQRRAWRGRRRPVRASAAACRARGGGATTRTRRAIRRSSSPSSAGPMPANRP